MKKLIILLVLLFASTAYAADTCTYKMLGVHNGVRMHRWYLYDNSGTPNGTVDCSATSPTGISTPIWGWIIGFKVVPDGSTKPDSSYNVALRDSVTDFNYFFGEGDALDGTVQTGSGNVDVPVTDAGAYPYLFGEQVYIYASLMGSSESKLTVYIYVKE